MANQRSRQVAGGGLVATACVALTALLAPPASGQLTNSDNPFRQSPNVWIYHSRDADGFSDGSRQLPLGSYTLGLWATGGANPSVTEDPLCTENTPPGGQELCALNMTFQLTGPGQLLSFTAASGLTAGVFINQSGKSMNVNLVTGTDPLPAGFPPAFIGDLSFSLEGQDSWVTVAGVEGLGPDTASHPVTPQILFAPEPASWLGLACSLLGLAGLHALRSARAR